jgi:hypothetical protein
VEGKGFRRFVDFPRNAQDTFESTNKLLLKVLTLLTNDEVGTTRDDVRATHDDVRVTPDEVRMTHESVSDMAGRFEALGLQSNSSALSAAGVKDCCMHCSRSLPSKELWMLGPEKLSCVASRMRAVLDCKVGGVEAAVGASKGWAALV